MTNDPVERTIKDALETACIPFEQQNACDLDFYLPDYEIYIECKAAYTERITRQLQKDNNIILIQGLKAAHFFADMIMGDKE